MKVPRRPPETHKAPGEAADLVKNRKRSQNEAVPDGSRNLYWDIVKQPRLNIRARRAGRTHGVTMTNLTTFPNLFTTMAPMTVDINAEINPLWAVIIRWTIGAVIFLVGTLGNIMVCVVVYRNQRMQRAMNLFLVNLAVWDILVCLFNLPFTLIYFQTYPKWLFGLFWCKTLPTLQVMNLIASTGSLVAVTVERYRAICLPFTPPLSRFQAKLAIGVVFMASLLFALPEVGAYTMVDGSCEERFPSEDLKRAYSLFIFLGVYLIPLLFIFPLYAKMIYELWRDRSDRSAASGVSKDPKDIKRRRNVLKMMAIVVTCFAICMLPTPVLFLVLDYGSPNYNTLVLILPFCQLVVFINSCINPIIYWLLSNEFSSGFKRLLQCNKLNSWSRQQSSTTGSSEERRQSLSAKKAHVIHKV